MSAASAIHINIFGPHPIVVFGSEEQKQRWLPDLIQGTTQSCFGVTEPDAGLNTTSIKTRAVRTDNGYQVDGRKIWTSTAQEADQIMLLTRTTPKEECAHPTDGMTLFYTRLDRDYCDVHTIPKMGRAAVDSCEVFIDGLPVPEEDRIGEEGKGFHYLLHSLNPERILIRGGSHRHRPKCTRPRHAVRQGPHRVRTADRSEPIDPASAGAKLDGTGGGLAYDDVRSQPFTTLANHVASRPMPQSTWPVKQVSRPAPGRLS